MLAMDVKKGASFTATGILTWLLTASTRSQ